MAIRTRDEGGDGREWVRRSMHPTVGQYDMIQTRQVLMQEKAKLRYRMAEVDEELRKLDAAQEINGRL